jgi:hypothetical protein
MTTTEAIPSRCPACGEIVGVYEPAISLTADGEHLTGNHHGRDAAVVEVYHRGCLASAER